jgi:hypothetical protein
LRHCPWKHPRRNRQRRGMRYANPINAASKSDTPRVSGDRSGAREGQSTAGADTEERLTPAIGGCSLAPNNRPYSIQHRPSAVLVLSVLPEIRGHRPRRNATRWRRTPADLEELRAAQAEPAVQTAQAAREACGKPTSRVRSAPDARCCPASVVRGVGDDNRLRASVRCTGDSVDEKAGRKEKD